MFNQFYYIKYDEDNKHYCVDKTLTNTFIAVVLITVELIQRRQEKQLNATIAVKVCLNYKTTKVSKII